MKRYFILFFLIVSGFAGEAQVDSALLRKNIYASEDSMIAIFKRRDWKSYTNYMNPVLIEMMGGKEGFVQYFQEQMKFLDVAEIQVIKAGEVLQIVKLKDQYQCIAESFLQMKIEETIISGSSYDIGVSKDGIAWTFLRITEDATQDQIREFLPDLSPDLKLPRSQMKLGKTLEEFMASYTLEYLN
ncbi:MAG TPA: hypothetical protein VK483_07225 [Chitinophagaceae bacterium]|nr:hypothetical protein [Chitinophagaceae bacterium]